MAVKRVLAVENNEYVLSFIELSLGTAGYEVDTAHNGREALAKIDRSAYDVIISDVRMPDVDGLELCRELERRRSRARDRLLFLTNLDTVQEHREFFDSTRVPTLTKPVALAELCGTVEQLIGPPRD
jgi:two-component system response regulator TrcR